MEPKKREKIKNWSRGLRDAFKGEMTRLRGPDPQDPPHARPETPLTLDAFVNGDGPALPLGDLKAPSSMQVGFGQTLSGKSASSSASVNVGRHTGHLHEGDLDVQALCMERDMLQSEVSELRAALEELEPLREWQQERRERLEVRLSGDGRRRARLERGLQMNVAKELRTVSEGRVLEKVTQKRGSSERRTVSATYTGTGTVLKWDHPVGKTFGSAKTVELSSIIRMDYGHGTGRATVLFPGASPWVCFSLSTVERSFDFICPDEYVAQCFVVGLSRLCYLASGTFLPGAPRSRSQYIAMKGWCKLEHWCMKRRMSLPELLLEALRKVGVNAPALRALSFRPQRRTGANEPVEDVKTTYASGAPRDWPKKGETWLFTGAVREVDVYKAADGEDWANQIKCRDQQNERRAVTIEETAEAGQSMVHIRGTGKMRFVHGWVKLADARGVWLLEKSIL